MRNWHNLIIILIIMSLFGCRTMDGQGSAAGAGTYPLKSTPAAEDTVLLTIVDATKAGGFDIRRTPVANMPVSTPVSTALALKQNASSAITESDVQDIVDDAVAGIPGSTVVADGTDPTKAAAAVVADSATNATTADSATYATTAGTAGTVAAVSGDAVTSGTVADTRIASTIARDSEVTTAVSITATGFNGNLASTDDTIQELAQKVDDLDITAGTITADTTDPTKAAVSVLADTATTSASVDPIKTPGVPGMMAVCEADGASTLTTGFIGPANSTVNFVFQFPNGVPSPGDTFVMGTALTGQTLPNGSTGTIIPLTHAAGGSSANDTAFGISWDGDTTTAASKNALYDKLASLETQVTDMIAAFSAAGLNSFTFPSSSIFPIYTNDATYTLTVDITDTSTTYAVDAVNYKLGSGEYAAMTNTTGDTWSVTLPTQTEGAYDLQFNASDDKSTPNTGESAAYPDALIVDLTNPSVGTVTPNPATHDGTGTAVEVTVASITETYEAAREYQIYNVTDAAVTEPYQDFTGLTINETLPADTDTYRFDVRAYDLAGNIGSASSAGIVYSGGTTYYLGMYNTNTTTMVTTIPSVGSTSTTTATILKPVTIPAGATLKNIWVCYKGIDAGITYDVGVYTYVTLGGTGTRVAGASVAPVANTWTESSALTGTLYFASETPLYITTSFTPDVTTTPILGRASGGTEYLKAYSAGAASIESLTTSSYTYAIVVEYEL